MICESEDEQIFDHFFSQVVVDSVDLRLGKQERKLVRQTVGCLEILAEWFFNNQRAVWKDEVAVNLTGNLQENVWWESKIKNEFGSRETRQKRSELREI